MLFRICFILHLCCVFFFHMGHATPFPFELVGQFDDELIRHEFRTRVSLRKTISLKERGIFTNIRLFLGVDDEDSAHSDRYSVHHDFPQPKDVHWFNVRAKSESLPDYPTNWTTYLMQWLYPSSAGHQLTVNQGLDFDPVRVFTPQTIGVILDTICHLHEQQIHQLQGSLTDGLVDAIEETLPNRSANSKRRRKALTRTFVESLGRALAEQAEREGSVDSVYPQAFIESALFNFALEKATSEEDVTAAMTTLYNAMPNVVIENWQPLTPFSQNGYLALKDQVSQSQYEFNDREQFELLCGLAAFGRLFPEPSYYSTARYQRTSFSNCGEASLLTAFRALLWSFQDKQLRPDLLRDIPLNPHLLKYFTTYPTEEAQDKPEGAQAWTDLVSGLNGQDITYKKPEGPCEITGGVSSMAGVIRALLGDQRSKEISTNDGLTSLERAKLTFDHMMTTFSRGEENWTWQVSGNDEDEEPSFRKETGFSIEFKKSGNNVLVIDGRVYDEAIVSWEFKPGHYEASYPEQMASKFLAPWIEATLKADMTPGAGMQQSSGLNDLERWAVTKYWYWEHLLYHKLGLQEFDEELLEDYPHVKLLSKMSEEYFRHFCREGLVSYNFRNYTHRIIALLSIVDLGVSPLYTFVNNLCAGIPESDIQLSSAILYLIVDDEGNLKNENALSKIHPAFRARQEKVLSDIADPAKAFEYLLRADRPGEFRLLLNRVPSDSLEKTQVLKLMHEMIEEAEYTPEVWDMLFTKFGALFSDHSGQIEASQFMTYTPTAGAMPFVEKLFFYPTYPVLKYFVDKGWVTKAHLLSMDNDGDSNVSFFIGSWYRVPKLLYLCKKLDIRKHELTKAMPQLFMNIFQEEGGENTDYMSVIDELGLEKSDFLDRLPDTKEANDDDENETSTAPCTLVQLTLEPQSVERFNFLVKILGVEPRELSDLAIFPSTLEHVENLIEKGFLTRDSFLRPEDDGFIPILTVINLPEPFNRLKLICNKLGITKADLPRKPKNFVSHFFSMESGEDADYIDMLEFLKLTKDDFLQPIQANDQKGRHKALLFQTFLNCSTCKGSSRINLIVQHLDIKREEILEAGKGFSTYLNGHGVHWGEYLLKEIPDLFPEEEAPQA